MNYKFLIYISYNYAIPIGEPLQQEIEKRGDTVKWFADISETNKYFSKNKNILYNINDVISYRPDIVLCATNIVPDFITGLKVQIFHGFNAEKRPSKKNKFSHFRIRGFFDLYCTQGPSTTIFFKEQAKKHKHFEVMETGWSKMDPLFPLEVNKENNPPNILIASTFTKRLSLAHNDAVFQEVSRLSSLGKFNFSMVLHPKMEGSIVSKWKNIKSPFFTYHDTTNLIPLFKKADILFADTTSVIQEFLLQKKTVVAFNHTTKHNYLIHVNEIRNIEIAFLEALKYPEKIIKNIALFILDLHPYFDGLSSKRIVETSINFLHKDKSYLEKKPIDLIRKYKIRKNLNYFTLKSYRHAYTVNKKN